MTWNGDCSQEGCEREAINSDGLCNKHRAEPALVEKLRPYVLWPTEDAATAATEHFADQMAALTAERDAWRELAEALDALMDVHDEDFYQVLARWGSLPERVRAARRAVGVLP